MKLSKKFQHEDIQAFKFGFSWIGAPKMFVHVYFINGLLIDTGPRNMQSEVFEAVKELPVEKIFVTHYHEDHSGNIDLLQSHFNCPVYCSALCKEIMASPPSITLTQKMIWGNRPPYKNFIVEENRITTPEYAFELIPIPGHAPDMFGLFEKTKGWFFSADVWVWDYIRYFLRTESMKTQIESLKRVRELDFEVLLCSHNPQFKGVKERIQNKIDFFENFTAQVLKYHQQGYSPKAIMKQMHLKENWQTKILSGGFFSTLNMVRSVIRDEENETYSLV